MKHGRIFCTAYDDCLNTDVTAQLYRYFIPIAKGTRHSNCSSLYESLKTLLFA